jgi:hypothetical protein
MRRSASIATVAQRLLLATAEWYCDGVGLVRVVREEPAQATFLTGGTLTMAWVAWQ